MTKFYFIFLIVITFFGCENSKKSNGKIENRVLIDESNFISEASNSNPEIINVPTNNKTLYFSEFIDEVKLIKLETKKESLIGEIHKLLATDNRYFIMDKTNTKSLFCFNSKGEFLFKINKKGKGPGEYQDLTDFVLNEENKSIQILDYKQRKIIIYDWNGEFIEEEIIPMGMPYLSFEKYNNDGYLIPTLNHGSSELFPDLAYSLLMISNKGKIISRHLPFIKGREFMTTKNSWTISKFNNQYNFISSSENMVYRILNDTIAPRFKINFNERSIKKSLFDKYKNVKLTSYKEKQDISKKLKEEINEQGYSHGPYKFLETNKFIYMDYKTKNKNVPIFYSKNSSTVKTSNNFDIDLSLCYALYFGLPFTTKGNDFIGVINPYSLIKAFESSVKKNNEEKFKERCTECFNLVKSLSKEDNPVLTVIKLKDF